MGLADGSRLPDDQDEMTVVELLLLCCFTSPSHGGNAHSDIDNFPSKFLSLSPSLSRRPSAYTECLSGGKKLFF